MIIIFRTFACITLAAAAGGCWSEPYGNNAAQYLHRSDTITLSAGNAKEVNAATHVIDPWPRYVGNRRIPADGERMVGAAQRYHRPGPTRPQGQIGQAGGSASGASTLTPPSGAVNSPVAASN